MSLWDKDKDRELQIRLAELQADVQINLTACFGFLAVFVTAIIGFEQIYFSLPSEESLAKSMLFVLIVVAGFVLLGVTLYFLKRAQAAREQMKELRKRYSRKFWQIHV